VVKLRLKWWQKIVFGSTCISGQFGEFQKHVAATITIAHCLSFDSIGSVFLICVLPAHGQSWVDAFGRRRSDLPSERKCTIVIVVWQWIADQQDEGTLIVR
jgi:hypothetical protein